MEQVLVVSRLPVRQPTRHFLDSLIGSIGSLYVTIISFALLYSYVGTTLFLQGQTLPALVALDKLLLLREMHHVDSDDFKDAEVSDLPSFFVKAKFEQIGESMNWYFDKNLLRISKFTSEPLENSKVVRNLPMRMATGGTCDVLKTELKPGYTFQITTKKDSTQNPYSVMSENVELLVFGCESSVVDAKLLSFDNDYRQQAYAMPREWIDQIIPASPWRPFESEYPARYLPGLQQAAVLVPQPMAEYSKFDNPDQYVVVDEKVIDSLILNYVESRLGIHVAANKINEAVERLYEQKENEASYFGITAPITFLVKIGPLIYFVLSIELWRRVRRLPSGRIVSDKYWFAFETKDWGGRAYSTLYAFIPVLLGFLVYSLFAISQNLGIPVFGRWVTLTGLITLDLPRSYGADADIFALFVASVALLQFLISILTVQKLYRVVAANRCEPIL
jgi:hypothetical protein